MDVKAFKTSLDGISTLREPQQASNSGDKLGKCWPYPKLRKAMTLRRSATWTPVLLISSGRRPRCNPQACLRKRGQRTGLGRLVPLHRGFDRLSLSWN